MPTDLCEENRAIIEELIAEVSARLEEAGCGRPYARKLAMRALAGCLVPPEQEDDVEKFLIKERTDEVATTIRIGDLVIPVSRGSREVTVMRGGPGPAGNRYKEVKELVRDLKPGDPSYILDFPERRNAELTRNVINGMSCLRRGSSDSQRKSKRMPWPLMVVSSWTPSDIRQPKGTGSLEFWVVSREAYPQKEGYK